MGEEGQIVLAEIYDKRSILGGGNQILYYRIFYGEGPNLLPRNMQNKTEHFTGRGRNIRLHFTRRGTEFSPQACAKTQHFTEGAKYHRVLYGAQQTLWQECAKRNGAFRGGNHILQNIFWRKPNFLGGNVQKTKHFWNGTKYYGIFYGAEQTLWAGMCKKRSILGREANITEYFLGRANLMGMNAKKGAIKERNQIFQIFFGGGRGQILWAGTHKKRSILGEGTKYYRMCRGRGPFSAQECPKN